MGDNQSHTIAVVFAIVVGLAIVATAITVVIPVGSDDRLQASAASDPIMDHYEGTVDDTSLDSFSPDSISPASVQPETRSTPQTSLEAVDEEGERPLAEAGLDQDANVRAPVYLDAGGSYAPDGEIESYEWEIARPDGTTTTPECATCVRTNFRPQQVGTYAVTVTVTATNGLSDNDTMYVEVLDRDPPSVDLDGPDTGEVGEPVTLELDATPGTHPLMAVSWYVDDEISHSDFLDEAGPWEESMVFDAPGVYTVTADVVDESGLWAEDDHVIDVETEGPFFHVRITDTNSPVGDDEDLDVTATVENIGDESDTQSILLTTDEGHPVDVTPSITLDPGESTDLDLTWPSCLDASVSTISVESEDHTDEEAVVITEAGCDGGFFAVDDVVAPAVADGGDTIPVEAAITNTGDTTDTQLIVLEDLDGEVVAGATTMLTLDPGETEEVELAWETDHTDAGEGEIAVRSFDDRERTFIEITKPPFFEVSIDAVSAPELDDGSPVPGDGIEVVATIENVGDQSDRQHIELREGGLEGPSLDRERNVRLSGGESETVTLLWELDEFDVTEQYRMYVNSDDDSDAETLRIDYDVVHELVTTDPYDDIFPEAMYPGQTLNPCEFGFEFQFHVGEFHVYRDGDGNYIDHVETEWKLHKRGYLNANTDWDGYGHRDYGPVSLQPICNTETCDWDSLQYFEAEDDAEVGETTRLCVEPWYKIYEEGKRDRVLTPSSSTEDGEFGEYKSYCNMIEIVDRSDDGVVETGRIQIEFLDARGNPFGDGKGEGTHDGIDWSSSTRDGWVNFTEVAEQYDVTGTALETGEEIMERYTIDDHEIISDQFQFDTYAPTGEVVIEVVDEDSGNGIQDVRVTIHGDVQYTDSSGEVRFDDVPVGEHEVTTSYDGVKKSKDVEVESDDTITETFRFDTTPTGTLKVEVEDLQGDTVSGANVYLDEDNYLGNTNSFGWVEVEVEKGTYQLDVIKGEERKIDEVDIPEDEKVTTTVTLDINGEGTLVVRAEDWMGGYGLEGAIVEENTSSPDFSGTTDGNGEVSFILDAGTYEYTVTYDGETVPRTVKIEPGETETEVVQFDDSGFLDPWY